MLLRRLGYSASPLRAVFIWSYVTVPRNGLIAAGNGATTAPLMKERKLKNGF